MRRSCIIEELVPQYAKDTQDNNSRGVFIRAPFSNFINHARRGRLQIWAVFAPGHESTGDCYSFMHIIN
jgi:hypothetical protein